MINKPYDTHSTINNISHYSSAKSNFSHNNRVQRKLFLQLAIRARSSQHLLAQMSFQLAPKTFWRAELISQFFCYSNSSKNITSPSGKIKTEFTNPIAKSTCPRLLDTTFLARCNNLANHNQRHPMSVFCQISVWRSKNCLEFSIPWGGLTNSRWPFHSPTNFEAYRINSLRFSEV